jgi:hypothetical protein
MLAKNKHFRQMTDSSPAGNKGFAIVVVLGLADTLIGAGSSSLRKKFLC